MSGAIDIGMNERVGQGKRRDKPADDHGSAANSALPI